MGVFETSQPKMGVSNIGIAVGLEQMQRLFWPMACWLFSDYPALDSLDNVLAQRKLT